MHGVPFGLPGVATDPLGPRACRSVMGAVPVDPGPVRFQAKPHKTLKEAGSRKLGIFDSVLSNECYINNNDAPLTEQHNVARKATLSSWPASRRRGYGMTDKTDDILASVEASSRSRCSRTCRIMQPESKALRELTADDEASADREELKFLTEQAARIRQRLQVQAQQLRVPPIQAAAMLQPELQLQPQCVAAKLQGVQVQVQVPSPPQEQQVQGPCTPPPPSPPPSPSHVADACEQPPPPAPPPEPPPASRRWPASVSGQPQSGGRPRPPLEQPQAGGRSQPGGQP